MSEISDFAAEARSESAAGRANEYGGAAQSAAQGLLNRPDTFTRSLGGGADPVLSQAIRSKANQSYGLARERIELNNLKNASADHLQKLQVATQMAQDEYRMNFEKEMLRKQQAQAKQMMRGQLIGSVLGITGGVVGGVMGSGAGPLGAAAGAQAGMALGSGVGQVAGSGM